ncbi:glycosyltransferase family 39 protein [Micromonospora phytophila]|uniref:glycosyltransferase family 39 protein n=1 Tax=Micromonospora phytophila TaxID=709888 RepID=UPI0020304BAC|nr:glycosyltransferase family 39 protein [Micromonospora phytophila]MCM0676457.1 glycosyltransferase family 39 protein [Micromonospora phytophila]
MSERTGSSVDGSRDVSAGPGTTVVEPPVTGAAQPIEVRWRFWPLAALVLVGAALYGFWWYSANRPPIGFGYFARPPIYGIWLPHWDELALTVIPAGVVLAAVGWVISSWRRVPSWLALSLVVVSGVATAATIALVRGQSLDLTRGVSTDPEAPYYTSDLHFVYELGLREFVERHPEMNAEFHSYSSRTHPAGVLVFLYLLFRVFGASHSLRIATAIALLAVAAAVATWLIGRTLGGERAGRIGAVLFVAAPGPLMLAYTNLDTVFATLMTMSAALFVLAIHRRSVPLAATAGAVLGVGTVMTFATSFIVLAATIAVLVQTGLRTGARLLAGAAGGGVLVLALAWLLLGFDVFAAYQSSPGAARAYDAYWILASPAAWLIYAGLPLAALGVAGLFLKVPGAGRPVLPLVLVSIMVVWAAVPPELTKLRPGEVERTWAFLYPLVAASAGLVVDAWTRRLGRWWGGAIVAALVALSVGQAVLLQGLWDNFF